MASLCQTAADAATAAAAHLRSATERGDVAQAVADAARAGHIVFLLADTAQTALADEIAAALRRRFPSDPWPPLLAITASARPLALLGCEYGVASPLTRQAEMLVRASDVVLVLAGARPSTDLLGAVERAVLRGAVVVGLGLPPSTVVAHPGITLPEAGGTASDRQAVRPVEQLIACQLALGHALADALAAQLPAEHPPDVRPALVFFGCINCNATLTIPRHLAGRRGVCPYCYNNTILAPDLSAPVSERRARMRFALREVALRVSLAPPGGSPLLLPGTATLGNLSTGGALFTIADSRVEVQPGDPLLIELTTPAFQRSLDLRGVVKRVTREANLTHIGLAFGDLAPAVAERLRILESNLVLRNLAAREPKDP